MTNNVSSTGYNRKHKSPKKLCSAGILVAKFLLNPAGNISQCVINTCQISRQLTEYVDALFRSMLPRQPNKLRPI